MTFLMFCAHPHPGRRMSTPVHNDDQKGMSQQHKQSLPPYRLHHGGRRTKLAIWASSLVEGQYKSIICARARVQHIISMGTHHYIDCSVAPSDAPGSALVDPDGRPGGWNGHTRTPEQLEARGGGEEDDVRRQAARPDGHHSEGLCSTINTESLRRIFRPTFLSGFK